MSTDSRASAPYQPSCADALARVLVTPRSLTREGAAPLEKLIEAGFEVVLGPAGRLPSGDELRELLPGCVGYLAGVEPISAQVLHSAPSLRVISRNGAGIDNVNLEAAQQLGIRVLRAAGANAQSVAELAVGLLFAASRSIPQSASAISRSQWERSIGRELRGRRLGVVGAGAVGRQVAQIGVALGLAVMAHDPFVAKTPGDQLSFVALDHLMASCPLVSLHCPPPAGGEPLLTEDLLQQMPRNSVLVNTARATLVRDEDVLMALDNGTLAAYATDVFLREPPQPSALLAHPRVIATAHIGAYTEEGVQRATDAAINNLIGALRSPIASGP